MGSYVRGDKNIMGCYVRGEKNSMGCFVRGGKSLWDVLSGVSRKWHGMFCPGMFCLAPISGSSSNHQHAIDMAFHLWADNGPLLNAGLVAL